MNRTKSAAYDTGRIKMKTLNKTQAKKVISVIKEIQSKESDPATLRVIFGIDAYTAREANSLIIGRILKGDMHASYQNRWPINYSKPEFKRQVNNYYNLLIHNASRPSCYSVDKSDKILTQYQKDIVKQVRKTALEILLKAKEDENFNFDKEQGQLFDILKREGIFDVDQEVHQQYLLKCTPIECIEYIITQTEDFYEQLAREFSALILDWIGKDKLQEVVRLNSQETNKDVCHSHDFCDTNQAIIEVCEKYDIELFPDDQDAQERVGEMVDSIWDIAKENNFYFNN